MPVPLKFKGNNQTEPLFKPMNMGVQSLKELQFFFRVLVTTK